MIEITERSASRSSIPDNLFPETVEHEDAIVLQTKRGQGADWTGRGGELCIVPVNLNVDVEFSGSMVEMAYGGHVLIPLKSNRRSILKLTRAGFAREYSWTGKRWQAD